MKASTQTCDQHPIHPLAAADYDAQALGINMILGSRQADGGGRFRQSL
jgi:hypothetical protein